VVKMSSIKLITAEDLRNLRKKYNLTQKKLAKKAGVSQSLISRIENKTVDPRLSTIKRIFNSIVTFENKYGTAKDVMHYPVITINAMDTVYKAINLMREKAISQLPVLKDNKIIGSIRESTLINRFSKSRNIERFFSYSVYNIMDKAFVTVKPDTDIDSIIGLFLEGKSAVLVLDHNNIAGIITKIDVLSPVKNNNLRGM
jgi:predicted transcriptional regulator